MNIKNSLQQDFAEISRCGVDSHGAVQRLAFTAADQAARDYLKQRILELGGEYRLDAAGNQWGFWPGQKPQLAPVVIGSHLDSVPDGGHFDGVVGIIAGLAVVAQLQGQPLPRGLALVNFAAEESSRFGVATLGSKAVAGKLTSQDLRRLQDAEGMSAAAALAAIGGSPDELEKARWLPGSMHAFLEVHIEQGRLLADAYEAIGVVEAIAAADRWQVTLEGVADHSGNTPMGWRRDALAAAAELVLAVEETARNHGGPQTVATVGRLQVEPGALNVIPGRVELAIDLRDIDSQTKAAAADWLQQQAQRISQQRGVEISWHSLSHEQPVPLSNRLVQLLKRHGHEQGIRQRRMASGAGHDAMNLTTLTDVGMLFVPSDNGISHNPQEHTSLEPICAATRVLLAAVRELAQEEANG